MRIAGVPRTDHPRTGEAGFLKQLPAHKKALEQDVAQAWHLVQDAPQVNGRDLVGLAVGVRHTADQRRSTREHVDIASELAGSVQGDADLAPGRTLGDFHFSVLHDEELEIALACGEQCLAGFERLARCETA